MTKSKTYCYNYYMTIVYLSFAINILVAGFWGVVLFRNRVPKLTRVFGQDSPGLRILASLYLSIAILSLFALIHQEYLISIAYVLFSLQIVYKVISAFSVRDFKNPVVISNLVIATIHAISIYTLYFIINY